MNILRSLVAAAALALGLASAAQASMTFPNGVGAVASVAGKTGVVTLQASDLTNGVTGTGAVVLATSPTFTTSALFPDGGATLPGIAFSAEPATGLYRPSTATTAFIENGVYAGRITAGTLTLRSSMSLGWTSTSSATNTADTLLVRDAANTLGLANGANAQTFNIYNTTDGTNKEYLSLNWASNIANITTTAAGTGVGRTLALNGDLSIRLAQSASGEMVWGRGGSTVGNVGLLYNPNSLNASSGVQYGYSCAPTINQSVTAGYTCYFANVTESATGSGAKLLMDLQVASASKFSVSDTGAVAASGGFLGGGALQMGANSSLSWFGRGVVTSPAVAQVQLGSADAAAPVAQTLSAQSVVAGTTDTAGADFTIKGSAGTGAGVGGGIVFATAIASTTGSTQNTLTERWRVSGTSGNLVGASGNSISFSGRGAVTPVSDGVFEFTNNAGSGFTRLQLGGTTSGFPSLKVSGNGLQARLADDSANASISAASLQIADGHTVAGLATCNAGAKGTLSYVTDATSPTYLGTLTGGGAVVAPVFCNGTAWVSH